MTKFAAIYTRISQADDGVDKPADQEAALRRLAEREGYEVADVFTDDDVSAFEGKHDRPGFRALVGAVAAGRFQVVMATEPQRFTRGSATELEALNLALTKAGAVYHTLRAGVQDPATPMVRGMIRMQDTLAWLEVAVAQDRQRARNAADRARGLPKRALRPFGWEKDGITLRESEARLIRAAVTDLLSGGSTTAIARRWTERGVKTDGMGRPRRGRDGVVRMPRQYWTATTVRQLLLRERNAGLLVHAGEIMPNSQIQPIISVEELRALRERVKPGTPMNERAATLLGGVARCGGCGAPMHGTVSYSQRKGGPRHVYVIYKCSQVGLDRSRMHTTIVQATLDAMMPGAVFGALVDLVGKGLDQAETPAAVAPLLAEKGTLNERRQRAQQIALLPGADLQHLKRELAKIDARVQAIDADVDAAFVDRARKGALATATQAVRAWQGGRVHVRPVAEGVAQIVPTDEAKAEDEAIRGHFAKHWESLGIPERRRLIKATVSVTVTPKPQVTPTRPRVLVRPLHWPAPDDAEIF